MKETKHLLTTVLVALLFSFAFAQRSIGQKAKSPRAKPAAEIPIHDITLVVRSAFGQNMEVVTDTQPFYLLGDFNGDSHTDIAVLVNPEKSKAELKQHNVKYIDVDPSSPTNGREQDPESARFQYCYGVAVIHGTAKGWRAADPTRKYLF